MYTQTDITDRGVSQKRMVLLNLQLSGLENLGYPLRHFSLLIVAMSGLLINQLPCITQFEIEF